jgi:hypothetical protein
MMTEERTQGTRPGSEEAETYRQRVGGELHDLVEDRLPAGWQELPEISQATLTACQAWAVANARLQAAQKG